MGPTRIIRELEAKDFESLRALILSVYDESPSATTFDARPGPEKLGELMQKKLEGMKDGSVVDFVIEEEGEVIADCEIARNDYNEGLVGIIVSKNHRRKGLGRELLETALGKAAYSKIFSAFAEIKNGNKKAGIFFRKCGFEEAEKKPGSVIMKKLL